MILFLIPFPAKPFATDWELACRLLQATLDSVANQSDRRFRVILCCHDIPDLQYKGRPEELIVHPVSFRPGAIKKGNTDKMWKLCSGHYAAMLSSLTFDYLFPVDADDLIHKDLVGHIMNAPRFDCWQARSGFQMDHRTGRIFPTEKLHEICGTSFCLAKDASMRPSYTEDPFFSSVLYEISHKEVDGFAKEQMLSTSNIPFHSIIYRVNNNRSMIGDSRHRFSVDQARLSIKNFVKFSVLGRALSKVDRENFGMTIDLVADGLKIEDALRVHSEAPSWATAST